MDSMTIGQQAASGRMVTYAGFWKRFVAAIIDSIILSFVSMLFIVPLVIVGLIGGASGDFEDPDMSYLAIFFGMYLLIMMILFVMQWLYHAIMESTKGASLGKMAMGIRVTDMSGNPISFGRATGRYFAKIISSITFLIGYIMAGFTQQKQALHDIISGCLVINKD